MMVWQKDLVLRQLFQRAKMSYLAATVLPLLRLAVLER
jgi:hypothetical protein